MGVSNICKTIMVKWKFHLIRFLSFYPSFHISSPSNYQLSSSFCPIISYLRWLLYSLGTALLLHLLAFTPLYLLPTLSTSHHLFITYLQPIFSTFSLTLSSSPLPPSLSHLISLTLSSSPFLHSLFLTFSPTPSSSPSLPPPPHPIIFTFTPTPSS